MNMFKVISRLAIAMTFFVTALANAEVAVIVSASNANSALDQDTISRVFLGKTSNFPDGSQAIPVDQNEGSASREAFNDKVLGKSSSQLKAYWSRLIFTGKGTPPKESGSDADIKNLVAKNPNLIGYVDSSVVDSSVKVVFKF
ncbi:MULTISPECIES: type 2 periplasmic-binding domain-containing protein [Thalassolituus]|jgi:ABC-type phosphate transport system substrate-binding protein|uniref:phosphate ABC transporter substrate-binding protein n=1 Tax=Thalassolituus TaxID=187492 RepID=UPI001CE3A6E4|nr:MULTISPECIES: phosphate ABC transporter substrate-binding protein [Thalassolituus]MCB2388446.1 phosphate ABC transporter substrate-binding protein [Thalassolituus alkanivorans]MCB2423836.1 phosphate ABC transporter substrate-binding protein [Thalassolituus alkanivorans]|tara:strand:+ start:596 stop:1024 length:429 start_codon:yes stop_codon:yes gene_type:complete